MWINSEDHKLIWEARNLWVKNFKELLLEISQKPLYQQKTILSQTLNDWKGNLEQVDDICMIGVRIL